MGETASSSRLDGRIIAHCRCPSRKELFLLLRIGKLAGLAGAAIEPKPQKSELRVLGELHGLRMVKFKFKIWINRPLKFCAITGKCAIDVLQGTSVICTYMRPDAPELQGELETQTLTAGSQFHKL